MKKTHPNPARLAIAIVREVFVGALMLASVGLLVYLSVRLSAALLSWSGPKYVTSLALGTGAGVFIVVNAVVFSYILSLHAWLLEKTTECRGLAAVQDGGWAGSEDFFAKAAKDLEASLRKDDALLLHFVTKAPLSEIACVAGGAFAGTSQNTQASIRVTLRDMLRKRLSEDMARSGRYSDEEIQQVLNPSKD